MCRQRGIGIGYSRFNSLDVGRGVSLRTGKCADREKLALDSLDLILKKFSVLRVRQV